MSDLTLVGDELRFGGETVAVLVPGLAQGNSLRARLESAIGDSPDAYAQEALAKGAEDELDELRDAIGAAVKGLRAGKPAEDIAKALEAA